MTVKRWETRPLECWDKAKEMRRNWDKSVVDAESKHELIAQGNPPWPMGFPAIRVISDNPLGSMIAFRSDKFARECRVACEVRGWGREMCGYKLNRFGSMYRDLDIGGGKFPKQDLIIPLPAPCDLHTKRGQAAMDFTKAPRWQADAPMHTDTPDPERDGAMAENSIGNILDQIEDIERITGQKFDDERLIETLKSMWIYKSLAGEVCCLMQNVPSPLGQKDLYSFYTLGGLVKSDPAETKALWTMIRDEVKWRAEHQIAAVATERFRWVESMPPPWHFLKYYRYMEKYGAVCIGSSYSHSIGGPYEWRDGIYVSQKTPLELGWPLNTREDAIRALTLSGRAPGRTDDLRTQGITDMAKAFKVDGAILPLWRGGVGCVYGHREEGLALSAMGVNVMYYEGSQPGDRTDMDENRMLDQLDVWMESEGLRKLED
ncbi:MAG: 2-hydroxyacyl-CoA dehydratase [Chloroflexi bacterium]|nr:2-hydroxyacyl-CoA dehydratase [Chloroflexota bacterium]